MSAWSASLENELNEYLKDFKFGSAEDKKALFRFYQTLILSKGWKSIYPDNILYQALKVSYLRDFDELAIIPLLPSLCKEIANQKSSPNDKIGWHFLSSLFEEWFNPPYIRKGKDFEKNGPFIIADLPIMNILLPGMAHLLKSNGVPMTNDHLPGMDWVLQFSHAKNAYKALIKLESFNTEKFLKRLPEVFFADDTIVHAAKNRFWVDVCNEEGDYKNDVRLKHERYLQTKMVADDSWGTRASLVFNGAKSASGLDAALHGFAFHALFGGEIIEVNDKEEKIAIDTLAVYYKDSFDFTDDQRLGDWNLPHKSGFVSLTNETFRKYRKIMNVGQDFYIFSKNKIVSPAERGWGVLHYTLKKGGN